MKIFKVGFILNYPNEEGRTLDFRKKLSDIKDAVNIFNANYRKVKELKTLKVEKQEINFLFIMFEDTKTFKMNGRHLAFFSKRLYEIGWNNYSSIPSKLFKTSYIEDVTEEFLDKYSSIPVFTDEDNREHLNERYQQNLSDEDALKLIKNLIEIQNIGDEETIGRNRETLNLIKAILFKWIKG